MPRSSCAPSATRCSMSSLQVERALGHRQQLGLPIREPLGPVAAGVVSDARCATIIALPDMAAERGRPAGRDGAHDATLDAPEMTGMRLSERFAMAAEDVRHLQHR